MPGFDIGKRSKLASGNIEVGLPDTAGEMTISAMQVMRPP